MLPRRLTKAKSGITRAEKRRYPRHRKFVRSFECIITLVNGGGGCEGETECAHLSVGVPREALGGVGIKTHDSFTVALCRCHHALMHAMGEISFAKQYRIDLVSQAIQFALASPVVEVKDYARRIRT